MGLVFIAFTWLTKPSDAELAEQQRQMDSIAAVQEAEQQQTAAEGAVDTLSSDEMTRLMSVRDDLQALKKQLDGLQ